MGERDSLTISCDISGCTHARTHTLEMPMRIARSRKLGSHSFRDCYQQGLRSGDRLSRGSKLAHVFANFCMTVSDDCILY